MVIGGLDIGTTGCKIALYDENARLLDTFYNEYDAIHSDGTHEIDFGNVREGVLKLLRQAVSQYRLSALGVTSFGETFALLDENDNVLAPSMLYTDPRGEKECAQLCDLLSAERLTLLTGVKPHPMYSISKLMWFKNNRPELWSECKRVLLGEDFIVYSLTGKAQIDYSLAARTAAFDIEKKCWIKEIFDAAGINVALMSSAVPSGTVAGEITESIKKTLGIDYSFTVVNGCHDQITAMVGAGVFDSTTAMDGTGTVECIPVLLENKPLVTEFYEYGYSVVPFINGSYACYAFSFTGGATLKWFRDNFAELEAKEAQKNGKNVYAELDKAVSEEPTGILVLPHFAGAATPYMDNASKAAFVGITLETDKHALYKALMEGTSYEMLLNFDKMRSLTGDIEILKATGGGAMSDVWLQIKSDILGMDIVALDCKEVGAAGTAALAGKAIGAYNDIKETVSLMAKTRKVFTPNAQKHEKYFTLYKKYKNLYNAVKNL